MQLCLQRSSAAQVTIPTNILKMTGSVASGRPDFTAEIEARFDECASRYGKAVLILGNSHGKNIHNIFAKSGLFPFQISVIWHGCRPVDAAAHCQYEATRERSTAMPVTSPSYCSINPALI